MPQGWESPFAGMIGYVFGFSNAVFYVAVMKFGRKNASAPLRVPTHVPAIRNLARTVAV
jgi:hypothetical protein